MLPAPINNNIDVFDVIIILFLLLL